ncbi:MAG: molecular chaperone HtpG [Candidatus Fibromonas sp.]|jgi:molecular chaperone HtpG|nr:molecular chaperone HtpG [Candidatus Fibromonas sp.]
MSQKMEFQTEVRDLLHLMIHSLYSNKEIFLRELVSNAADALDKLRFLSIANQALLPTDTELRIDISANEETKILTVEDNGIGMNREELIQNLGTIARSGTKNFMQSITGDEKRDVNLIGQFGVGFYSSFMVASKVEVHSRKAGEEQGYQWVSEGTGDFSVDELPKGKNGTKITLYIKDEEDCKDFSQDWQIKSIVRKYSEFVTHPIYIHSLDKDKKENVERLNEKPAIWRQSAKSIEEKQYREFYELVSHEGGEPLAWSHNHVEGAQEFWSLLYVPLKAPFGVRYASEHHKGLKLYVKRVFIMDDCKELLPNWLRFARGVIDTEDLPLNVSREILQSNKTVANLKKHATKKILDILQGAATDRKEDYAKFWMEMGAVLKEGFYMNWEFLDELKNLLRFKSTKTVEKEFVGLEEYIARMPEGQKEIYFIIGESVSTVQGSPHLEACKSKGYEVLFLTDAIDEFMMQGLNEFREKKFHDVALGDLEFEKTKEEESAENESKKTFEKLCETLQKVLSEDVSEVRVTSRLKDSPCMLVRATGGMGAHMEKLMALQGMEIPKTKRILEINPEHEICKSLLKKAEAGEDLGSYPVVLYGQALLAEGSVLPDPAAFVAAMNRVLLSN